MIVLSGEGWRFMDRHGTSATHKILGVYPTLAEAKQNVPADATDEDLYLLTDTETGRVLLPHEVEETP